jgi:diguanylate cyclase (GGDEF)-like protein/PAS domain S-box-containing protein
MALGSGAKRRKRELDRSGEGVLRDLRVSDAGHAAAGQPEQEIQRLHRYIRQRLTEIEQVYRYSPVGLVLMDKDYRYVRINERMAEINGLPVEAHIGRTLREVVPELADHIMELYRPVYERAEPVLNMEIQGETPHEPGKQRYWLANFFPFLSETGEVAGLIGAVMDITNLKRQETELRQSEERFRTIFETVTDAIFIHDIESLAVVDVNRRAADVLGYPREELIGMKVGDLSPNETPYCRAEAMKLIGSAVAGTPQTFEWRCRRKDKTVFWAEVGCQSVAFGERNFLLTTLRDIDRRKEVEDALTKMAQFDALTGLLNRGVFVANLNGAITDARRRGTRVAVLYLDLDHFKDVNDTQGHPAGDLLLKGTAQRLIDNVRASDTVARFGGDEFAILVTNVVEPADAAMLAKKLIDAVGRPFSINGSDVYSSVTVGIALSDPDSDAETLLSRADVALYRAKAEGRQTYRFFDAAMDQEVNARVSLITALRDAIASEQLFLVYQPQIELASGRIIGVEALARWRHPVRGVLTADAFIPAAERSGLIIPLGRWALAQACRQARIWIDQGIAADHMAVNLSALQFKTPRELEKDIDGVLTEYRLPPHMLELELTETTVMETTRAEDNPLERLRQRGVRIAIDDFGTGYSSLAYLRRYPVDCIKLAREFITNLATDANDAAITQVALGLARLLQIDVVAEGVETREQAELLKFWGCRAAQGYYFAKPMSADEATALLRRGQVDAVNAAAALPPVPLTASANTNRLQQNR